MLVYVKQVYQEERRKLKTRVGSNRVFLNVSKFVFIKQICMCVIFAFLNSSEKFSGRSDNFLLW